MFAGFALHSPPHNSHIFWMQHNCRARETEWTRCVTWTTRSAWFTVTPHPVLRSVTRRQFVESSPTRPFRTTLHSKGRNSGEIRCSATSGDMLFILSTLRSLWRHSNTLGKCLNVIYSTVLLHSTYLQWGFKGHEPHHVTDAVNLTVISWCDGRFCGLCTSEWDSWDFRFLVSILVNIYFLREEWVCWQSVFTNSIFLEQVTW